MTDSLKIEPAPAPAPAAATLTLDAPAPVRAVDPAEAAGFVPISDETKRKLDGMVGAYLDAVTNLEVHGDEFAGKVKDISNLGAEEIRSSANVSNRLLEKPLAAMKEGGLVAGSSVSRSLLDLRNTVEELDPARQGDLLSPRKLLGLLPFGDRLREYFARYESSAKHISAVLAALESGRDELMRDNAAIEGETKRLRATMDQLRQYAYLAAQLDAALAAKIAEIERTDPARAKVLREDMLFSVRQKSQDLLTQLAVAIQGYLALGLIRRNNEELIRGVDRATTTTISALRTAVIVAQALGDQKLVLDQISALNTTTGNLIDGTSKLLREQSAQISTQAASATVSVETLKAAFANIYATMDEIDTFKLKALDSMQVTIDALSTEITKSQTYVERARQREGKD